MKKINKRKLAHIQVKQIFAKLITVNTTPCTVRFIPFKIKLIPSCRLNPAFKICYYQRSQTTTSLFPENCRHRLVCLCDGRPAAAIPAPSCDSLPFNRHWATAPLEERGEFILPVGPLWECRLGAISLGSYRGLSPPLRLNKLLDWGLRYKELQGALQEPPQWLPLTLSLFREPLLKMFMHTQVHNCP